MASYLAPCERPPFGGRSQIDFSLREGLNTLFGRLFGRKNVCTYIRRAEIISPEGDSRLEGGRAAGRWTTRRGRDDRASCFIIGTVTTPRRCISSPPHARRTARIVRDDRRCDSSRSAVGAEIGGGRQSTPPRRNATCTRRCSARASCRVEATQPRKSAGCCLDPTRGFGAPREPRAFRHAARVSADSVCRSAARHAEARRHKRADSSNAIAKRNTTKQHGAAT